VDGSTWCEWEWADETRRRKIELQHKRRAVIVALDGEVGPTARETMYHYCGYAEGWYVIVIA
jgi:hypothetical protein